MKDKDASSRDEGGHPKKRRKQGDEGDRLSKTLVQRNGILAGDGADIKSRDQFFGGHHHHYHETPPVGDGATSSSEALIKSLSFDTMNLRRSYISEECPRTCEWLLDTVEWIHWRQSFAIAEYPRLLWLKGHAGSGKSTIMKYAYDYASKHKEHDKEIVLTHFFNARAKDKLEKSIEGMYRTILVQLLENLQATHIPGDVARRALSGQINWDAQALLSLFRDILRAHLDRPVTCFIDALDECNDDKVRDMILRFRDLMEKESRGVQVQLRVFFSSRHYPTILPPPPDKAICMALDKEPGHTRDIMSYIESYLQVHDSPIAEEVYTGVQKKARGSFIWCQLVIDLLNKDNDEVKLDRTLYLRERLAAMPPELDTLFAEILGMNGEGRVTGSETILCLQWVLLSMRELTPQELWWAIRREIEPQAESAELAAMCQPAYLQHYILWASRGLVEIVQDERKEAIVQVIHESVRDFLLGQGKIAKLIGSEGREEEVMARSHEQMTRICWDELFVHAAHVRLPQAVLENIWSDGSQELLGKLVQELPLLPYTAQHLVNHANVAQRCGLGSMDPQQLLDDLERQGEHYNLLRAGFDIDFGFTLSIKSADATLTAILLYDNAAALIEPQYRRIDAAGANTHQFGLETDFGIDLALTHDREEAVEAVIDVHLRRHRQGDPRRDLLLTVKPELPFHRNYGRLYFKELLFYLANECHRVGLFFLMAALLVSGEATELLATQAQSVLGNFNALLLFVLVNPLHFKNFLDDLDLGEALCWAAYQGDVVTVQILLDKYHVNINGISSCGMPPLHCAAMEKHEAMVKFLLARDGIQPDLRDKYDETPLHHACKPISRNEQTAACGIVRRLLATEKVDVNARNEDDGTPLHFAATYNGGKLVRLLLDVPGIDVNARNSSGKTPLHGAAENGNGSVVEMMVNTAKIDINAQNKYGKTPRDLAFGRGHEDIAKLLADYGSG